MMLDETFGSTTSELPVIRKPARRVRFLPGSRGEDSTENLLRVDDEVRRINQDVVHRSRRTTKRSASLSPVRDRPGSTAARQLAPIGRPEMPRPHTVAGMRPKSRERRPVHQVGALYKNQGRLDAPPVVRKGDSMKLLTKEVFGAGAPPTTVVETTTAAVAARLGGSVRGTRVRRLGALPRPVTAPEASMASSEAAQWTAPARESPRVPREVDTIALRKLESILNQEERRKIARERFALIKANLAQLVWMEKRKRIVASFLPRMLQRRLLEVSSETDIQPMFKPMTDCFVAFIDISGFTRLSERLATLGRIGSERLQQILNETFTVILDTVYAHGGDCPCFAGDGIVAIWQGGPDISSEDLVLRAAACATGLQSIFAEQERVPKGLRISISVAFGDMLAHTVGGLYANYYYLVTGSPFQQLAQCDAHVQPDQIVLSPQARAHLTQGFSGVPLPSGFLILHKVFKAPRGMTMALMGRTLLTESEQTFQNQLAEHFKIFRMFVSPVVLDNIADKSTHLADDWVAELRRVSVAFITIPNFMDRSNLSDPAGSQNDFELLQNIVMRVQQETSRTAGVIIKVIMDDKGLIILLSFGLPRTHDDDALRAVATCLAIQRSFHEILPSEFRICMGISTSNIFCGSYGSTVRREYDILGDGVNLAARLMGAASRRFPNESMIFCCEDTYHASRHRIDFEQLDEPLKMKGKVKEVMAYIPLKEFKQLFRRAHDVVGREKELALLRERMVRALGNDDETAAPRAPTSLVLIEGEPGLGKTVLVSELDHHAKKIDATLVYAAASSIHADTPFYAFNDVFSMLFADDDGVAGADRARRTELPLSLSRLLLRSGPQVSRLAPLFRAVFPDRDVKETYLTTGMSNKVRHEKTHSILFMILAYCLTRQRLVLVMDDAQYLDPDSVQLLSNLARNVPNQLIVVLTRPVFSREPVTNLVRLSQTHMLRLDPMSPSELVDVACQTLEVETVPVAIIKLLKEKSGGNPFWCQELMTMWKTEGILKIRPGGRCVLRRTPDSSSVPDSVGGLITSRMDQLPKSTQLTLKVASVIPTAFELDMIKAILPHQNANTRQVQHDLSMLVTLGYVEKLSENDVLALQQGAPAPSGATVGARRRYSSGTGRKSAVRVIPTKVLYRFQNTCLQEGIRNTMLYSQRKELDKALQRYMWSAKANWSLLKSLSVIKQAEPSNKSWNVVRTAIRVGSIPRGSTALHTANAAMAAVSGVQSGSGSGGGGGGGSRKYRSGSALHENLTVIAEEIAASEQAPAESTPTPRGTRKMATPSGRGKR